MKLLGVFISSYLFNTVTSVPIYNDSVASQQIIDQSLSWGIGVYDELSETAMWAKLSYCASKKKTTFKLGELKDSCPKMKYCRDSQDTEVVQIFKPKLSNRQYSGNYLLIAKHLEKKIILAFRGTDSIGDWVTNAVYQGFQYQPVLKQNFKMSKDTFNNCQVHRGIFESYSKIVGEAEKRVKPFVDEGYQLVITGHSLGGGYAYLAGVDFLLAGYKPIVINYSSLRIGNIEWNSLVDKLFKTKESEEKIAAGGSLPVPSLARVIQTRDPVPQLPPMSAPSDTTTSYGHSGLLFEINKVPLPHLKEDVMFRGATSNELIKSRPDFYIAEGPKYYAHSFLFDVISSPCDDSYYEGVNYPGQEVLDNIIQGLGSFLSRIYNNS